MIVSGLGVGLRSGLGVGLNPTFGGGSWATDSGFAYPATSAEWSALIASDGALSAWSAPNALWLCDEASGSLVDEIGGIAMAPFNAPGYAAAVPGRTGLGVSLTDGTANQRFQSTSTSLPDTSTSSFLVMADCAISVNPAAVRQVVVLGTAGCIAQANPGTTTIRPRITGGTVVGGSTDRGTGVIPWVARVNRATSEVALYTNTEKLTPTFGTPTGQQLYIGSSGATPPSMTCRYIAAWFGTAAERSDQEIRDMLEARGYVVSGYGV